MILSHFPLLTELLNTNTYIAPPLCLYFLWSLCLKYPPSHLCQVLPFLHDLTLQKGSSHCLSWRELFSLHPLGSFYLYHSYSNPYFTFFSLLIYVHISSPRDSKGQDLHIFYFEHPVIPGPWSHSEQGLNVLWMNGLKRVCTWYGGVWSLGVHGNQLMYLFPMFRIVFLCVLLID